MAAANVFGNPIDGKQLSPIDRARAALKDPNAENKYDDAQRFVENLKAKYGDGLSTLCLVYNATGEPVTFITRHNWDGHIREYSYPLEIANAQWAAFLHLHPLEADHFESSAGVVYRGKSEAVEDYDFMFSWTNPEDHASNKCLAYTMVREVDHFRGKDEWDALKELMIQSASGSYRDEWEGCVSKVTINVIDNTTALYNAILTLKDAENPSAAKN